jgi:hypothetical protein
VVNAFSGSLGKPIAAPALAGGLRWLVGLKEVAHLVYRLLLYVR